MLNCYISYICNTHTDPKEYHCLNIGCASGEEPFTFWLLWREYINNKFPQARLIHLALDRDNSVLKRAQIGCYSRSSVRNLPVDIVDKYFIENQDFFCIDPGIIRQVNFKIADIRNQNLFGLFHIVFCRNLVFTYFDEKTQVDLLKKISEHIFPGGLLILGAHENLLKGDFPFQSDISNKMIYHRL